MKKYKYKRLTAYDERLSRYYVVTQLAYNMKYKKNAVYHDFSSEIDRLAEFENLLEKYKVDSLYELEQILESRY